MFRGIIQDVGRVQAREARGGDVRLTIAVDCLSLDRTAIGDSISVQGTCLTVTALVANGFSAHASPETFSPEEFIRQYERVGRGEARGT